MQVCSRANIPLDIAFVKNVILLNCGWPGRIHIYFCFLLGQGKKHLSEHLSPLSKPQEQRYRVPAFISTCRKHCSTDATNLTNQPSFILFFHLSVCICCIFLLSFSLSSSLSLFLSLNALAGSLHLYWNQLHESSGIC